MLLKPMLYLHHVNDKNSMIAGHARFQSIIQVFHAISSKLGSYTKNGGELANTRLIMVKMGKTYKKCGEFCLGLTWKTICKTSIDANIALKRYFQMSFVIFLIKEKRMQFCYYLFFQLPRLMYHHEQCSMKVTRYFSIILSLYQKVKRNF